VPVNLPMFGLSNTTMLLEEVSASDQQDNFNIWYTITAVQGPYDQSATYFWKKLLQSPAPANTINVGITSSQGG
jgi:hypothetical protein